MSIKEILETILKHYTYYHENQLYGFCKVCSVLSLRGVLSEEDVFRFHRYLEDNAPDTHRTAKIILEEGRVESRSNYFWDPEDKDSRIEWLDYHIKKNS